MHRQPLPLDIVHACATTCVVREVRGKNWVLETRENPGENLAPMPIPDRRSIRLLGIAAPRASRRSVSARKPDAGPCTAPTTEPASNAPAGSYGAGGIDVSDLF